MQTLDQKRAAHAWKAVTDLKPAEREEFGIQAKKLPARVITSGLGQSLAFLEAKKYAPELLLALTDWVKGRPFGDDDMRDAPLVQRVIMGDAEFLRYATAECLAYLQWLVRFADAADAAVPQQKR